MIKVGNSWQPTVNEHGIYGFFGEYRWLSNFHVSPCEFDGIVYPSSEHAYQAAKTMDLEVRELFLQLKTPGQAKKFGAALELPENWDQIKVGVMGQVLLSKFMDLELREKLLATEHLELEETNYWGDRFWGVCDGEGENNLGILLKRVRSIYAHCGWV